MFISEPDGELLTVMRPCWSSMRSRMLRNPMLFDTLSRSFICSSPDCMCIADSTTLPALLHYHQYGHEEHNDKCQIEPVLQLCHTVALLQVTQLCLFLEGLITHFHLRESRLIFSRGLLLHRIIKKVNVKLCFRCITQGSISLGKSLVKTDVMLRILIVGIMTMVMLTG